MKIKNIIYIVIAISLIAIIVPLVFYYKTFHKYHLSESAQDWANFGSYIGGIYSAIFGFFSTCIVCLTLYFTLKYNKEQLVQIKKEHISNLIKIYAENLNTKLDKKDYVIYFKPTMQNLNLDEHKFLKHVDHRFKLNLETQKNNNENHISNLKAAAAVFDDIKIDYSEEIGNILTILELISSCKDHDSRKELVSQFRAVTHIKRTFWLMMYAYFNLPNARESIALNPELVEHKIGNVKFDFR